MSLVTLIAIGLGGSAGALARSVVGPAVQRLSGSRFPWGTLAINVVACFIAGFVLKMGLGGIAGLALTMGFLGGFSTLSTVVFESIEFIFHRHVAHGVANLVVTYAASILVGVLGFMLAGIL